MTKNSYFRSIIQQCLKTLRHHWLPLFLLVIFSLLFYAIWYFSLHSIAQGDWRYYYPDTLIDLFQSSLLWNNLSDLGSFNSMFFLFPLWTLHSVFGYLGFSFSFIERAIYMYSIPLLYVFSPYVLFYSLSRSRFIAFFGSLFYAFNTYVLVLNIGGHLTVSWVVAILPLALFVFISFLRRPKYARGILMAVLLALMSMYEVRVTYIAIIIFVLFFIINVVSNDKRVQFRLLFKPLIVMIGTYILLSSYWFLPFLFSIIFGSGLESVLEGTSLFHPYISFDHAISMYHPFWTNNGMESFVKYPVPFIFFLLPFCIVFFYKTIRKGIQDQFSIRVAIPFFSILAIAGILLTKQDNAPWAGLYVWLFQYFPGFSLFRESSKFYIFVILSYAFFLPYVLRYLWLTIKTRSSVNKYLRIGYAILFFCILSTFAYIFIPRFTGTHLGLLQSHEPSQNYMELTETLRSDGVFGRVLWNPRQSQYGYFSSIHPAISVERALSMTWRNEQCPDGIEEVCFLRKEGDDMFHFARNAALRYAVVPETVYEGDGTYGKNERSHGPQMWLGKIPNLFVQKRISDDLVLYRFTYPEGEPSLIEGRRLDNDEPFVVFNEEAFPNTFLIRLNEEFSLESSRIFLSYAYSNGWKLYKRDSSRIGKPLGIWESMFLLKPTNEFQHVVAGDYYNGWDVQESYFENEDLTHEYILRFQPMNYLIFGLIISGIVFVFVSVYFVIFMVRKRRAYYRGGERLSSNSKQ